MSLYSSAAWVYSLGLKKHFGRPILLVSLLKAFAADPEVGHGIF